MEVFLVFLRLGLTSFGGPAAHIGYFQNEFVQKKKWLSEQSFLDLVALCQFLPGPASSQVGIAIGLRRAGLLGALAAWVGFTMPSALVMTLFGLGMTKFGSSGSWIHGLKVVAVAVVAQAVLIMSRKICMNLTTILVASLSALLLVLIPGVRLQILVLLLGGLVGVLFLNPLPRQPTVVHNVFVNRRTGAVSLTLFSVLVLFLPAMVGSQAPQGLRLFDIFFRVGSLVFGGGHVVLPLLQTEVVSQGWISKEIFMAGYGAVQAAPGPLFSFAAYLGSVSSVPPAGWVGAWICLAAIFLPSFLLVIGILPYWEKLQTVTWAQKATFGVNAAVIGLLIAAFYSPVWVSAILGWQDFGLALIFFMLLVFFKMPSWFLVALGAACGFFL